MAQKYVKLLTVTLCMLSKTSYADFTINFAIKHSFVLKAAARIARSHFASKIA